jgi:hypothetical protein
LKISESLRNGVAVAIWFVLFGGYAFSQYVHLGGARSLAEWDKSLDMPNMLLGWLVLGLAILMAVAERKKNGEEETE